MYLFCRRTEELLNGVYGQYLLNQMGSTTNSHISFPHQNDPSAPPSTEEITPPAPNRTLPSIEHNAQLQNHDIDINQVDSGHPSLETSISPNGGTSPSSTQHTPENNRKSSNESSDGVLKNNPFIVNGIQRAPNKIILEPIEHPIKEFGQVPRHLFAAKNPNK